MKHVLIVEDEIKMSRLLQMVLEDADLSVSTLESAEEALSQDALADCDVLITDLRLGGMSGLDLLKKVKAETPDLPVILMTAYATVETAVEAMKEGAFDYIVKPFDMDDMVELVRKAISHTELLLEGKAIKKASEVAMEDFVVESGAMKKVLEAVKQVAPTKSTVLIYGESGSGKEVVARAIHRFSDRAEGPFVIMNCAAIPENLMESELFGHVKGAFTGADADRRGRFEQAEDGILFFDEIGALSPSLQPKLLRVLQDGQYQPVGTDEVRQANVRIIAASNKDLEEAIGKGEFREDLFYRLNVFPVQVPPLRERKEEIPPLVLHFIEEYNRELGKHIGPPSETVLDLLTQYEWPGNVRELKNIVERAMVLSDGEEILPEHLPNPIYQEGEGRAAGTMPYSEAKKQELLRWERHYLERLLKECGGNVAEAARKAQKDKSDFYALLRKHNINPDDYRAQ